MARKILLLFAVAVVVVSAAVVERKPKPAAFSPPPGYHFNQPVPQPRNVLIVGDSYAAGTGATDLYGGFAELTAVRMGWFANLDAQGDTGFVADGHTADPAHSPYPSRLATDRRYLADYVIITGGRNDAANPNAPEAASSYLKDVRLTFAKAKLVVVAPFWSNSNPPPGLLAIRDSEQRTATQLGAVFIDPLAGRWITDEDAAQLIGPDHTHPTPAGHRYLAERLVAALRAAGVVDNP